MRGKFSVEMLHKIKGFFFFFLLMFELQFTASGEVLEKGGRRHEGKTSMKVKSRRISRLAGSGLEGGSEIILFPIHLPLTKHSCLLSLLSYCTVFIS